MALQIAPLIVPKHRRPIPDGVLLAIGHAPQMLFAANNGAALSYAPLSDFLSSIAELRMRKGIEPDDQAQYLPSCKHEFSNGNSASIVLKRKGMTAACKELETALVLTSVSPRYPCYRGT